MVWSLRSEKRIIFSFGAMLEIGPFNCFGSTGALFLILIGYLRSAQTLFQTVQVAFDLRKRSPLLQILYNPLQFHIVDDAVGQGI